MPKEGNRRTAKKNLGTLFSRPRGRNRTVAAALPSFEPQKQPMLPQPAAMKWEEVPTLMRERSDGLTEILETKWVLKPDLGGKRKSRKRKSKKSKKRKSKKSRKSKKH